MTEVSSDLAEYTPHAEAADHATPLTLPERWLIKGRPIVGLEPLVAVIKRLADQVAQLNARLNAIETAAEE